MGKKWLILLSSFAILTFISSLISIIIVLNITNTKSEINGNTLISNGSNYQNTIITYYTDNNISLNNLNPGDKIIKKFTISNENSNDLKYKIVWQSVQSTWEDNNGNPEEFTYTLTCSKGEKISRKMPIKDEIIIEDLELKTNEINNCTLTIDFININDNEQAYNLNKSFNGKYNIQIER